MVSYFQYIFLIIFMINLSHETNFCESVTITSSVNSTAFTPIFFNYSTNIVAISDSTNRIYFWDTETHQQSFTILGSHDDKITSLKQFSSYPLLASSSYDKTVIIWDLLTPTMKLNFKLHRAPVLCLEFSAKFGRVFSGDESGVIFGFNYNNGELINTIKESTAIKFLIYMISLDYLVYLS